MEGFNLFKNKKSKTEATLGKISKIAKLATLGTGLAIGASNLEAQEIHQNKNDGIKPELEKTINIEDEKDFTKWITYNQSKQDVTKVIIPLSKKNKDEAEYKYYNPEMEKDITSGNKQLDYLYKNQWLYNVPILKNIIKDMAYNQATQSSERNRNLNEINIYSSTRPGNYRGRNINKVENLFNENKSPNLIDTYFNKENSLQKKSAYIPTNDYLNFLPSFSVKGTFESLDDSVKNNIIEFALINILKEYNIKNNTNQGKDINNFIEDKNTIYTSSDFDTELTDRLDINLAGHKEGIAWDYSINLPYISIADAWDFNPDDYIDKWGETDLKPGINKKEKLRQVNKIQSTLLHKAGQPFKIYDRFYFDPITKKYISDEVIKKLKDSKGITPLEDEAINKDISKYFSINNTEKDNKENYKHPGWDYNEPTK